MSSYCHTSKGERGLLLAPPPPTWLAFSYASDADLLLNLPMLLPPENGDTGGVDPAGEIGGDPLLPLPYPGGFTIIILRVTLVASSVESSPYDPTFPPSDDPLAELDRKLKVLCLRSLPRPISGRGPATVSSQSWSSRPMLYIVRWLADTGSAAYDSRTGVT